MESALAGMPVEYWAFRSIYGRWEPHYSSRGENEIDFPHNTGAAPERPTRERKSPRVNILFTPFIIGDVQLPNRILMAPLTRCRTGTDRVPNDIMVEYYRQRATAGLIITEATIISPQAPGYVNTPGIY